ncbi:ATP-dependent helicase [Millisia brevis]|uniref:ATP-dependent helicase n=1 Tax=Millisia brevis TaxID=264148 RepID=UPI0008309794|nr:ATP-dependent helicase [Millisia brevis]
MSDTTPANDAAAVLGRFSGPTRRWFTGSFAGPTAAQVGSWDAISSGHHTLVVAPTGSGKTLSAFLWAIDRLLFPAAERASGRPAPTDPPEAQPGTRVLYISPLKALAVDVERNLRAPLAGIARTSAAEGLTPAEVSVGVRSGDTPSADRRALIRRPPSILITTPESLFLMLTSSARETLRSVDTVIVDEIHAIAGSKRGSHLALSLARLDRLVDKPVQRIGLSATVRPPEEVARFLAGSAPVRIVKPPSEKRFDLSVRVPVADMTALGDSDTDDPDGPSAPRPGSIWPHVEEQVVDLIEAHSSTIVFANSRGLAERLTARLNEIHAARVGEPVLVDHGPPSLIGLPSAASHGAPPLLARAHHGSVSKEQRAGIEDDLKAGRLRCVVATSSLELGIDMGAVDLVIQVEAPPSVAGGLQRIGRAGHSVGEVSEGVLFPKHRTDVLHCAVTVERMASGAIEQLRIPANPLDVLAQHTVAACALEPIDVGEWFETVRSTGSYSDLPESAYLATLDLLSGRYPSSDFAELRPRVVWDRDAGTLTGRPGAQRLAVTSGGAIPDRGLFTVWMVGDKPSRIGELDEEMVYESRTGDVFALGATSWRIEEITHDRVLVSPAYGLPGRLPFWHGDGPGRPAELGRAIGEYVRAGTDSEVLRERARRDGLDAWAVDNLVALLEEQRAATGKVPTDRTLVLERFRDELGDWRLVLLSPYGRAVHAPWALAIGARLEALYGVDAQPTASDDGIIVRLPDTSDEPPGVDLFVFDPEEIADVVTERIGGSALFASRFRECAARALLLPRRDPGRRAPLWQQRRRSAQLLDVARRYPEFPILLETARECLQDVYDLPGLTDLHRQLSDRRIRVVEVETATPSPFAASLLFAYVGEFLYEGDSPLAERRAAALSLDSTLLAQLLGRVELRELLDADVIATTTAQLQRLAPDRRVSTVEAVADLLRILGPLDEAEIAARTADVDATALIDQLIAARRVIPVRHGETTWFAAIEDAARLRDGLGIPLPPGIPTAFTEEVADPVGDLLSRFARTRGPFTTAEVADRFAVGPAVVREVLGRLAADNRVVEGEFTPGGAGSEWCDVEVLRMLRRRSLAAARKDVEPVSPAALGRFLPRRQHIGADGIGELTGVDGVLTVIEQLAGAPIPASAWETMVLPARVRDYRPTMLDELTAGGEVVWVGSGAISGGDGWVSLHPADLADVTVPLRPDVAPDEIQRTILEVLASGGAYFFGQLIEELSTRTGRPADTTETTRALWDLVWAGLVTNDTLAPLRAGLGGSSRRAAPSARVRRPTRSAMRRPLLAAGRSADPRVAGRWTLTPVPDTDPTVRAHTLADTLLDRHGVVTRGAVAAEAVPGGFSAMYTVLTGFEDNGRARRGYFVDGLGGAQFATADTVDRLRAEAETEGTALVLAATDPANPYGAALPWPEREGHRPGRKAGALVVLVGGEPVLFVERGGKSMLTFTTDPARMAAAAEALVAAVHGGRAPGLLIERADGESVFGSPPAEILTAAGFVASPRGMRLRAPVGRAGTPVR